jgi:RimJ/RimL family protein N-acetyltransferase
MITINQSTNLDNIKTILQHPILFRATFGQTDKKEIELDPSALYLEVLKDKELVGICQLTSFTAITAIAHIAILPECWGQISRDIINYLLKYVKQNLFFTTIITSVPETSRTVHKILQDLNFTNIGIIPEGIFYHGKYQDLTIYSMNLRK